jgi:hypothetical protein
MAKEREMMNKFKFEEKKKDGMRQESDGKLV